MAKYKVIILGTYPDTNEGMESLVARFAKAYKMDVDQARSIFTGRGGIIYDTDDKDQAIQGLEYLKSLGAVVEMEEEGVVKTEKPVSDKTPQMIGPADDTIPAASAVSGKSKSDEMQNDEKDAKPRVKFCPKCGAKVSIDVDECPSCQIFISKYEKMMEQRSAKVSQDPLSPVIIPSYPQTPGADYAQTGNLSGMAPGYKNYSQYNPGTGLSAYQTQRDLPPGAPPNWPSKFLRTHTLSDIFQSIWDLYSQNFGTLIILQLIPLAVVIGLIIVAGILIVPFYMSGKPGAVAISWTVLVSTIVMCVYIYAINFFGVATIYAIRDIIFGFKPDFSSCLKKVDFILPLKYFATHLIVALPVMAALIPTVVISILSFSNPKDPSVAGIVIATLSLIIICLPVIFCVWMIQVLLGPVVVVENKWSIEAIQRSYNLGKPYLLRNLGIVFVIWICMTIGIMMISMIPMIGGMIASFLQFAAAPVPLIVYMFLYYDMLLKKEPHWFSCYYDPPPQEEQVKPPPTAPETTKPEKEPDTEPAPSDPADHKKRTL